MLANYNVFFDNLYFLTSLTCINHIRVAEGTLLSAQAKSYMAILEN